LRRSSRIIVFSALAGVAIFAAAAAYASQASGRDAAFDSNLAGFMMRSDSSLLKIIRHNDGDGSFERLDEYTLATSDAELYKYLSATDKAHNSSLGSAGIQLAYMEVIVSSGETRTILKEIRPELQSQQENPDYDIYAKHIEMSGKHYALELYIPK
jgi:hypothetical protein